MRGFNQTNLTIKLFHMRGETIRGSFILYFNMVSKGRLNNRLRLFIKVIQT
jgi:hypothetical protein